jgi:hypothetical protein
LSFVLIVHKSSLPPSFYTKACLLFTQPLLSSSFLGNLLLNSHGL